MRLSLAVVCIGLLVCHVSSTEFPGVHWTRNTPEQQGVDSAKLKAAIDHTGRAGTETYCSAVTRNGILIGDHYWMGGANSEHIVWSVSKAWMATLIGTAERDRKFNSTELMGKWIPEWAGNPKTNGIRMEEIMRHCSGRYYDPATDFVTPQLQTDQTKFAVGLSQQHAPGTVDQYNQMAYQTLQQVFEKGTGLGIQAASQKEFYGPMQFESKSYWQMNGFFTGVPQKHPLVYGGLTTSCLDLARFGLLWLNHGKWKNYTVFTEEWFTKAMAQPTYPFGPGRRYGNWGTGADIRSVGFGKQVVMFNPKTNIVATRLGGTVSLSFDYNDFWKAINDAIIKPEERGNAEDWMFMVS